MTLLDSADAPVAPPRRRLYLSLTSKFILALVVTTAWVVLAVRLSEPWVEDLRSALGPVPAWTVVVLIAYLPGGIVAFLTASLSMDRQPPLRTSVPTSPVTVIVAARDEESGISETMLSLARLDYPAGVTVVLADNGSTDLTVPRAVAAAASCGLDLRVVHEPRPGKSHALNTGLGLVETAVVVTIDADTVLNREAMLRLVARLDASPADTVAVAGSVLVRNSRANLLTRVQEWDYYLGIAAVKRMQGLYQSTLVAQGAFSLYRTDALREVGGWPDAIGEDIVVTWRLLERGRGVVFEPTAVAFTDVPERLSVFMRQRSRWARGMLEGLVAVPPWRQARGLTRLVASVDVLIPLLDVGYALVFLPGILLLALGHPLIVSLWTLAVLPVTMIVYGGLRRFQSRRVFGPLELRVRRNRAGYVAFLLAYQVLCSTASLVGYTQFLTARERRWK